MKRIDIKKEALSVAAGLGLVLLLYAVIIIFKLNFYQIFGLVFGFNIVLNLYMHVFKGIKFSFKKVAINGLTIFAIMFILRNLSYFGYWGYILGLFALCGFILFRRRKKYLRALNEIETIIWGKPLPEFKKEGKKPKRC